MRELLRRSLKPKRFRHSCAVFDEALKLADRFDADRDKVAVAALLHDCGREVPTPEGPRKAAELGLQPDPVVCAQPILAHPLLGAWYAEHKYGVTDPEILDAIRLHTTGGPDMTQTAKIVFLADMTEPARDFPGVDELRSLCRKLADRGPRQIVITSVPSAPDKITVASYDATKDAYDERAVDRIPFSTCGTGDLFTSVLTGSLLRGCSAADGVARAAAFLTQAITFTYKAGSDYREGVQFEPCLAALVKD